MHNWNPNSKTNCTYIFSNSTCTYKFCFMKLKRGKWMNGKKKNVYYSWYTLQPFNIYMTFQMIHELHIQGTHTSLLNITIDH